MNKYAIINENGVCCGIAITSGTIDNDKYILIDYSFDPTNKRWNGSDWEDYTPPEPPEPEKTQLDRIESNTNAIMEKESSLDVLLGVSE